MTKPDGLLHCSTGGYRTGVGLILKTDYLVEWKPHFMEQTTIFLKLRLPSELHNMHRQYWMQLVRAFWCWEKFNLYSHWPEEEAWGSIPRGDIAFSFPPHPVKFCYRTDTGVKQPYRETGHSTAPGKSTFFPLQAWAGRRESGRLGLRIFSTFGIMNVVRS